MKAAKEHKPQQSRVIQPRKIIQKVQDWTIIDLKKIEYSLNIHDIPVLIIDNNQISDSYNCDNPEFYCNLFILDCGITKNHLDILLDTKGGALYSSQAKCIFLLKNHAYKRYLIHELGHAKQEKDSNIKISKINSSIVEAHNIIVNENKYPYTKPPTEYQDQYLVTMNSYPDFPSVSKINMGYGSEYSYYRVVYSGYNDIAKFISDYAYLKFTEEEYDSFFRDTVLTKMYVDMKKMIHSLNQGLSGLQYDKNGIFISCFGVQIALTALMNWGLKQQIRG